MKRNSRRKWVEREARAADEVLLVQRLGRLGLHRTVEVHENSTVLVSLTERGVLRIHRGYAYGSDRILQAILVFVSPTSRRANRKRAERQIVAFPLEEYVKPVVRPRRRRRPRRGDRKLLAELERLHQRLNRRHFGGKLSRIRLRVSDRMRTRLGELAVDAHTHEVGAITISRRHVERDGWEEVEDTVLHEMIHQWQAECRFAIDHGATFRKKATEVGIVPRADRFVEVARRAARQN